jgi:hypothetical protein
VKRTLTKLWAASSPLVPYLIAAALYLAIFTLAAWYSAPETHGIV